MFYIIIIILIIVLTIIECMIYKKSDFEKDLIIVKIENGNPILKKSQDGYESRNETTFVMFKKLYEKYIHFNPPMNGEFIVHTVDKGVDDIVKNNFWYSGANAIPDYVFEKWDEVKLPKFHDEFYKDYKSIKFDDKKHLLMWIGSISTNENRRIFYNKYKDYEDFEIMDIGGWSNKNTSSGNYKTIEEHGEYKYLIDIEGKGYSGRLKYLLLLESVVFICDRSNTSKDYFFKYFEPWVHYVPVKNDMSDLLDHFEIMKKDQNKCKEMAINCRKRALEVFSETQVYKDFAEILVNNS